MAKDTQLEAAIIATFRSGNVVNISQLMGLVQSGNVQFRGIGTPAFRAIVFALEKEGLLKRETEGGVTRFHWNKRPTYLGVAIERQGTDGDWWGFVLENGAWVPRYEAMTQKELKQLIRAKKGS